MDCGKGGVYYDKDANQTPGRDECGGLDWCPSFKSPLLFGRHRAWSNDKTGSDVRGLFAKLAANSVLAESPKS